MEELICDTIFIRKYFDDFIGKYPEKNLMMI